MLGNRKLVVDKFCNVNDIFGDLIDEIFYDWNGYNIEPGSIFLLARHRFDSDPQVIRYIVANKKATVVFCNPWEGSATIKGLIHSFEDLVKSKQILLISGGEVEPDYPCLAYDHFLLKTFENQNNQSEMQRTGEIYGKTNKPYKFMFLNGRMRPHRKYLLERWRHYHLLDQAIWTSLETHLVDLDIGKDHIQGCVDGQNMMIVPRPPHYLDPKYEIDRYASRINLPITDTFMKNKLFDNEWGDVYIKAEPYIDSYFSVITETVFAYPWSFRTEKIWKPIIMGHPWIAVANVGFYRDLKNLGFRTFGHVIDESFDQIDNAQQRIERIATVVEDLCRQDLDSFLQACRETCEHNQQQLSEVVTQTRQALPGRLIDFIEKYSNC